MGLWMAAVASLLAQPVTVASPPGEGSRLGPMARLEATEFCLQDQLCFAAHSMSRALTASYRVGLDEIGLTYSQYLVMLVLWEQSAVTMGTLCDELHSDSGTLSPLLQRLDQRGLVIRRRRVQDQRTLEIALTVEGRRLYDRARDVQAQVVLDTGLDPDELAGLRDELTRVTARLRARTAATDQQEVG